MNLKTVKSAKVFWLYDDQVFLYESVKGTIVATDNSIRFELADSDEIEENFEVVIESRDHEFSYKADCFIDNATPEPLKLFLGTDEMIFFGDSPGAGRVYFHLYEV